MELWQGACFWWIPWRARDQTAAPESTTNGQDATSAVHPRCPVARLESLGDAIPRVADQGLLANSGPLRSRWPQTHIPTFQTTTGAMSSTAVPNNKFKWHLCTRTFQKNETDKHKHMHIMRENESWPIMNLNLLSDLSWVPSHTNWFLRPVSSWISISWSLFVHFTNLLSLPGISPLLSVTEVIDSHYQAELLWLQCNNA